SHKTPLFWRGFRFALQGESNAGSGKPGPAATGQCAFPANAATPPQQYGSFFICLALLLVSAIVRPETVIRWHRAGFRAYWRWRSRNPVGRPKVSAELRTLIGEMSRANP